MRSVEGLYSYLARLEREELALKTAQPTFGEGIVGYRYSGSVTIPAGAKRYLVFTRRYKDRPALVKMAESLSMTLFPLGVRSQNGVHVFALPISDFTITQQYALRSSQPGEIRIENTPPF